MSEDAQPVDRWLWVSFFANGHTYEDKSYDDGLSDVVDDGQFSHIVTLGDLAAALSEIEQSWSSPTLSYFKIDPVKGSFYRDQQDCEVWSLDEEGRVYVGTKEQRQFVAKTLAEFLARMQHDNTRWFRIFGRRP